mmetsp:Transcript_8829/g.14677  ORF Transcript_8829/g.14677 Transcript_8829/m.14677 type:complete len:311 (-) Transcript_8829:247-1179(-)
MMMRHKKGDTPLQQRRYSADGDKGTKKPKSFATVWNGWLLTFCVIFVVTVVAHPKLKASMHMGDDNNNPAAADSTTTAMTQDAAIITTDEEATGSILEKQEEVIIISIPECEASPWKPDEDLVGTCPGAIKPKTGILSAIDCAAACCASEECIVFQFRADKGCLHGKDVRIGEEKDGPAAYCSDHPPFRWQGQFLKDGKKKTDCSTDTWHPDEQPGQCFGLGESRKGIKNTAEDCMKACCADEMCGAWQFQESLGCFYSRGMHGCQKGDDPMFFESYVGRRKQLSIRTYTGKRGEPAKNWKRSISTSGGT